MLIFSNLTEEEKLHGVFQQGTATAHIMAHTSSEAPHKYLGDWIISHDLTHPCPCFNIL
jgi:hypothetical protein